ncbi:MAG: c-type cytochrome [Actinobacteria bacterium]|nr:c-type cytochrome [Actinomycetota bacterium]
MPTDRSRRWSIRLGILGLVGVLAGATAAAGVQDPTAAPTDRDPDPTVAPTTDPQLVARGRELFGSQCATCHGAGGRGGVRTDAPPLRDASPAMIDFVIRTGRMPPPRPDAGSVRRPPRLYDEQRLAIVAYVKTFARTEPAIPDPDPQRGDLSHGRELYEANCIACHSALGRGIAISQRDIAPDLDPSSPVEIAEAVRVGPGVMPVFETGVISDDELNDLIRYIVWLTEERERPGGLTIGRSGPVTEGFVSWGFGLVLLLIAMYFIGEHRRGS